MQSTNYQNMRSYRLAVTHPNMHLDFLTSGLMHAKGLPGTISLPTHTCTRLTALFWNYPVSQYQKGKTNLDFTEASDSEWQWHQLGCIPYSKQKTTPAPHHSDFYRPDALPAAQPTQSKR